MTRWVAGILVAGSLTALVWAQAAPAWKDQGESDMGLAAGNEKDPTRQLDLLKKWEQQYPDSALKDQRTFLTAKAQLAILGAAYGKTDAPSLDAGKKAAEQVVNNLNTYFSDAVLKAASVPADQWPTIRKSSEWQAHLILGLIAQTNKDDSTAEAEFKKVLGVDPTQATTSYYLGATILREMIKKNDPDPARYSEALYSLARSLSVTGPTALPAAVKTQANNSLNKNYTAYHGDLSNLADLMQQVTASALPPAGFHIQSLVDIDNAKQKDHAAWALAHPDLDFWETVKAALIAQGDTFFATFKDVGVPPPASETYKGPAMFKAMVVSQPSSRELLVNVDNTPAGDARLKFEDNIKGTIDPGTAIQFKGVVDAYTKEPYVLTLLIQEPKDDIAGLPAGVTFVPDAAGKPKPGAKGASGAKAAPKAAPKAARKAVKK